MNHNLDEWKVCGPIPNRLIRSFCLVVVTSLVCSRSAAEEKITPQQLQFFETKIRPVLVEHCYACHSDKEGDVQGGLLLDTREGIRRGGDSGPAVVPGNLQGSLLITAIRHTDDEFAMPPNDEGEKLPDQVIRDFEAWVSMGAPDPRDGSSRVVKTYDTSEARSWWAFQPLKSPELPTSSSAGKHSDWPLTNIDRFIAARWAENGLTPVADAEPHVWLRRLRFDLTGLPPSDAEVVDFVKRWKSPGNRETLMKETVDRLLDSREYAERWGRHWLDVARYAESSGKDVNLVYPHAWRYRDYVIDSFDKDKPFDQFVREQIAGDLLPAKSDSQRAEQLIATTFLAIGEIPLNERNPKQLAVDLADDQIAVVSQAFLGQTAACARCHDHRFDPISQRDYTALAGIFLSTETKYGTPGAVGGRNRTGLIELPTAAKLPVVASGLTDAEIRQMQQKLSRLKEQQQSARAQRANGGSPTDGLSDFDVVRISTQVSQLEFELGFVNEDGSAKTLAMGVSDRPVIASQNIRSGPNRFGPNANGPNGQNATGPGPNGRGMGPGMSGPGMRGPGMRGPGMGGPGMGGRPIPGNRPAGPGPGRPRQPGGPMQAGGPTETEGEMQPSQAMAGGPTGRRMQSSGFESIADSPLFLRGSIESASEPVPRGIPGLLGSGKDLLIREGSGRLELANALVSDENTLTSRVIVNRVWHWMMGRGLVESVDNFGTTGAEPSHPELLDYLVIRFVRNGWTIKDLIRAIALSRVYRLSSAYDEACFAADPDNAMLWRHNSRRLESEEIRDGILAASGQLRFQPPSGSLIGRAGDGPIGGERFQAVTLDEIEGANHDYRSLYLPATRSVKPAVLAAFDPPDTSATYGARAATNVPLQALFMLNSDFLAEQSQSLADLALKTHPGVSAQDSLEKRLQFVFRRILNRDPFKTEAAAARRLVNDSSDARAAWTSIVRGLFASAEFRLLD